MTKWLAMLTACLALALGAVACGDDEEEDSGGGGDAATEQVGPGGGGGDDAAVEPGGKVVEVSMQNIAFDPESVTVPKGGTVRWTNDESVGHDVTKTGGPGPAFRSGEPGAMGEGDTFEQTFRTSGKIDYVCTVHQDSMTGTITVR